MPIFRKSGGPHDFVVSMAGIRMADRLLQLGCSNLGTFVALGAQVGLSGQSCAVVKNEASCSRAHKAAARAGVLVEIKVESFQKLPYKTGSFDIAVVENVIAAMDPVNRVACLQEVRRVLSNGGRCLIIEKVDRGGLGALFSRQSVNPHYRSSGGAESVLKAEDFTTVRQLAEYQHLAFIEGIKPRQ